MYKSSFCNIAVHNSRESAQWSAGRGEVRSAIGVVNRFWNLKEVWPSLAMWWGDWQGLRGVWEEGEVQETEAVPKAVIVSVFIIVSVLGTMVEVATAELTEMGIHWFCYKEKRYCR